MTRLGAIGTVHLPNGLEARFPHEVHYVSKSGVGYFIEVSAFPNDMMVREIELYWLGVKQIEEFNA